MRILIGVIAVLLLLDVGVFFWPTVAYDASHVAEPKADINAQFIRLNKEIEAKYAKPNIRVVMPSEKSQDCYRLGPFMHQANYELAQAVLFNANVDFSKSTRASKESTVYRVYLGPYRSRPEVTDARVMLKRKNILDHFVRKISNQKYLISLGIYTSQESAQDALLLFDGRLPGVKVEQEQLVLPDSFWLHFVLTDARGIKQQLVNMDWGEQSAKLGKYDCRPV